MNRRDLMLGAVGAGLALAACGPRADQGKTVPDGVAIHQSDTSGRLPSNLPSYLAVYPGARVVSSTDAGARGGTVRLEAAGATAAQVAEFYTGRAQAAGLRSTTDVTSNDVRILMFADAPPGRRNFVLNLTSTPAGVQVAVTYGPQA